MKLSLRVSTKTNFSIQRGSTFYGHAYSCFCRSEQEVVEVIRSLRVYTENIFVKSFVDTVNRVLANYKHQDPSNEVLKTVYGINIEVKEVKDAST